ncbi:MAG: DUF1552 domain-containing protein [Verrucomicrobia subdivision 3 bacterium]|nr:DUF1552 domain-containing protein [Limisphaerales bacterium]
MNRKTQSTRRTFLKAAGVAIALPPLESFGTPAAAQPPMGLVCICTGLGMNPATFFPKTFGKDFTPSPVLAPLAPLRDDLTVFSHMDHPSIFTKHGGMNSFLSGVDAKKARTGENQSLDQVAAAHVGYRTRFPSVHISLGGSQGSSWTASGIKVREESDPLLLFKKLFVTDSPAARKARQLELDRQGSVLDLVRGQAKRLEHSINAADKAKLEEYLTAIREAEERIQGIQRWQKIPKPKVAVNDTVHPHGGMDYSTLSPLMFDLLHLALQNDSSRVFTAGFGMHNHVIELDGVTGGYHGLSHHGNLPDRLRELQIIETFYMKQMARFVQRLKDTRTQDANLLDRTMVLFGSGLGDAARHSNRNLPMVLAGGGFQHRGHVDAMRPDHSQTPLNNLYTTMLQNFGVETERFNGATGTFDLS